MKKLYMFSAGWCRPCLVTKPAFNTVKGATPDVAFELVDVDESTLLVEKYNIRSVPTFVLLKDDVEIARTVGGMTEEKIKSFINGV